MKTYVIRAERKVVGYYTINCKSLEEAKAQARYQMAVSPKTVTEYEKQEEIILPKEPMFIESTNEFTGKKYQRPNYKLTDKELEEFNKHRRRNED